MAREFPHGSALSKPENFIAEGPLRHLYRRYRPILWSALIVAAVGGGSAFFFANNRPGQGAHEMKTAERKALCPRHTPSGSRGRRPLWTAADFKPAFNTAALTAERLTSLPLPALSPEAAPAPAVEAAKTPDAQVREAAADPEPAKTAEAKEPAPALETERPRVTDIPKPADAAPQQIDAPKQAETVASLARAPEPVTPGKGTSSTIEKADQFLRRGQFTIARYLYEQAYQAGDVSGALGMAKSYDAIFLRTLGVHVKGDFQKSRIWYRRAAEVSGKQRRETP